LPIILGATCRRGDRTTKLCYGAIMVQTIPQLPKKSPETS